MNYKRALKSNIYENEEKKYLKGRQTLKSNGYACDTSYQLLCYVKNVFNPVLRVVRVGPVLISRLDWFQTAAHRYDKLCCPFEVLQSGILRSVLVLCNVRLHRSDIM